MLRSNIRFYLCFIFKYFFLNLSWIRFLTAFTTLPLVLLLKLLNSLKTILTQVDNEEQNYHSDAVPSKNIGLIWRKQVPLESLNSHKH